MLKGGCVGSVFYAKRAESRGVVNAYLSFQCESCGTKKVQVSEAAIKLVVFDLDFTLWDAGGVWCDCLNPPFRKRSGRVVDRDGSEVKIYEDAYWALDEVERMGLELGIASRTTQPDWARELLELLGVRQRFQWEEIYPSSKLRHFGKLQVSTGYAYEEMVFFDDESRNIEEVSRLGVRSIWVRNGFSRQHFEAAFGD